MEIIARNNWTYCVYRAGDEYIMSIPFGHSFVDFSRAFKVELDNLDDEYLSNKAEEIKKNYDYFKKFEVPDP
ncbi:hypothetical protein BTA51_11210 [Hahella sp. CCB-MM4]|uniref:hypothetical protein n=1 Tax=Hahella sp. (strain CCB-MM4) TaxID=1926491 RepID=UPI000B9C0D7A|nr:hypothetical protein [Hahella sp. CCB-MM4]OZG73564.1 hypothetical protein BTA51_11210 [Hahella sp. CCB-MM4]